MKNRLQERALGPIQNIKRKIEETLGDVDYPVNKTLIGQNVWHRENENLDKVAEFIINKTLKDMNHTEGVALVAAEVPWVGEDVAESEVIMPDEKSAVTTSRLKTCRTGAPPLLKRIALLHTLKQSVLNC